MLMCSPLPRRYHFGPNFHVVVFVQTLGRCHSIIIYALHSASCPCGHWPSQDSVLHFERTSDRIGRDFCCFVVFQLSTAGHGRNLGHSHGQWSSGIIFIFIFTEYQIASASYHKAWARWFGLASRRLSFGRVECRHVLGAPTGSHGLGISSIPANS